MTKQIKKRLNEPKILNDINVFFSEKEDKKRILESYKTFYKEYSKRIPVPAQKRVQQAVKFSIEKHRNDRRKSGEPYITHPIEVATIVVSEIGLSTTGIIAALLHDTVEDTDTSFEEIETRFGKNVKNIVEGLTKITKSTFTIIPESFQAENYKKLILTMSEDIRVVIIKLADRLHNLRTLSSMSKNGQLKIVYETNFLYAPIAHKLGFYNIKTEMEDTWFQYTHPKEHSEIQEIIKKNKKSTQGNCAAIYSPRKTKNAS